MEPEGILNACMTKVRIKSAINMAIIIASEYSLILDLLLFMVLFLKMYGSCISCSFLLVASVLYYEYIVDKIIIIITRAKKLFANIPVILPIRFP